MLDKNTLPDIDRKGQTNSEISTHIPISCHYDADTLLTKNGELIQIIEITGYENETNDFSAQNLREHIREAIKTQVPDYSYAVYIHTIRSRKNLMPVGIEPFGLADHLNKKWCKKNNWDKQLVNTVYISIVKQSNVNTSLLKSLFFSKMKATHFAALEKANKDLNVVVDQVLEKLNLFGARKLTMLKTDKGYISEQLMFYHHLIHLHQRRAPMPVKDLSEYLSNTAVNFLFNTIEVVGKEEVHYAAIFSVKMACELSVEVMDELLQMGTQFIITQVAFFAPASEAKKKLQEQYDLLTISKSHVALEKSGLKDFIESDTGSFSDYCKQQTTILIHSDNVDFFVKKVAMATNILKQLGIVIVREDFFMPKLFWGQLPGNFRYLKKARLEYLNSKRIGEFCTIHHHNAGSYKGSKWGPPVSLLRSFDGTPFFFNFHNNEGNGNSIILGPPNIGKTVFKNFFIAQASKLNPRVIYLDYEGNARNFIKSIGGECYYVGIDDKLPLKLNPFDMRAYNGDATLFKQWLITAIYPTAGQHEKYNDFFHVLAAKLIEQNSLPDKLNLINQVIISSNDMALIEGFNKVLGSPIFNNLFSQQKEIFGLFDLHNTVGLNLSRISGSGQLINSYVGLLLNAALNVLDGHPTIIVFNKLGKIYNMPYFFPIFGNWLDEIKKRNAIAFCSDSRSETLQQNKIFLEHYEKFGSKIFLSDKFADKYFKRAFKLTDDELYRIKSYSKARHMFLLKQDNLSLILALQLDELAEELKELGKSEINS